MMEKKSGNCAISKEPSPSVISPGTDMVTLRGGSGTTIWFGTTMASVRHFSMISGGEVYSHMSTTLPNGPTFILTG